MERLYMFFEYTDMEYLKKMKLRNISQNEKGEKEYSAEAGRMW